MVNRDQFRSAANKAVLNIVKHGDTDIFPFPLENHVFYDKPDNVIDLIVDFDDNFVEYLTRFSPRSVSSQTPVSYSGFRWATQIDPIWNAVLLTITLALSESMEAARLPKADNIVFSYRYHPDKTTGDLFDRDFGWVQFMQHSTALSETSKFVVVCDISDFYSRLGHHRLENALKQIAGDTPYPSRIIRFLSNYSNTRSFGLPIGGPAARILSEITINQVDRLLVANGIIFARFVDDYHLFAQSREDAYRHLIFLSEKLFENQGLSLQKSKTRIMTAAEFKATNPLMSHNNVPAPEKEGVAAVEVHKGSQLLRFSLRFDPYSATAQEDYERLKDEVRKFDIIGMLKDELAKSRIHTALARKIVTAIRYLEGSTKDDAVLSIMDSCEVLYPIFSSVLMVIGQVFEELATETRTAVIGSIQKLVRDQSHIFRVDVHLSYAIRVLAHENTSDNQALLQKLYEERTSPLVRRDIILVLAKWGDWYWLSDKKNRFRELSGPERRAFIVASYTLKDEGSHWRDYIRRELDPFEQLILKWAGEKANNPKWVIPL
jgi:hypothetical protein